MAFADTHTEAFARVERGRLREVTDQEVIACQGVGHHDWNAPQTGLTAAVDIRPNVMPVRALGQLKRFPIFRADHRARGIVEIELLKLGQSLAEVIELLVDAVSGATGAA